MWNSDQCTDVQWSSFKWQLTAQQKLFWWLHSTLHLYTHKTVESLTSLSWKELLELKAGPTRAGCSGSYPVKFQLEYLQWQRWLYLTGSLVNIDHSHDKTPQWTETQTRNKWILPLHSRQHQKTSVGKYVLGCCDWSHLLKHYIH